jgi:tetratricopeptide (TPR) repeat protein
MDREFLTEERPVPSGSSRASYGVRVADFIVSVVFVLLFLGTPLFVTGLTYQGLVFDKFFYFYALVLVGMVAWVTRGVLQGHMEIRRTPVDIPLVLFWAWYGITAIFSVDRWHSFMGAFNDPSRGFLALTFFIFAFYFIISHSTIERVRKALAAIVVAGGIVVVWSFVALIMGNMLPELVRQYVPISFVGTLTSLAIYLALLVPIFITSIFVSAEEKANSVWHKIKYGTLFVLLALTLFLLLVLYSFVPWLVVLVMATFFVIYIIAQLIRPAGKVSWLPMGAFVVILGFLMIGQVNLARISLPVEVSPTSSLSWQISKTALPSEWLTGTGPANYGYAFALHKPAEFNQNELYSMRFGQANNLFLEVLTTTGIIGFVLFSLVWLIFLGTGLYLLTYNSKETNKVISLGLWSVVVLFFVSALVVTLSGAMLLIFVPLLALAYAVLQKEAHAKEEHISFSLQATPKYALALAFTFMVVSAGVVYVLIFLGKVYAADMKMLSAQKSSQAGNSEASVQSMTRALVFYPNESRYYLRLAEEYMIIANQEIATKGKEADQNIMAGAIQQAIRAGEVAAQLSGNDVVTVESVALLYENALRYASDAEKRTEELYTRASTLDPINPLYFVKRGELKRNIGDTKEGAERDTYYKEALDLLDTGIEKKKNLGAAYYHKALVFSRMNKIDDAIEASKLAAQSEPGNASYLYAVGALHELRNKENDRDVAMDIYKNILAAYPNILDVRLALALAYEKKGERQAAIDEYQKAIELVTKSGEEAGQIKSQIQKLLDTVESGGSNIAVSGQVNPELPQEPPLDENTQTEAPALPSTVVPVAPAQ